MGKPLQRSNLNLFTSFADVYKKLIMEHLLNWVHQVHGARNHSISSELFSDEISHLSKPGTFAKSQSIKISSLNSWQHNEILYFCFIEIMEEISKTFPLETLLALMNKFAAQDTVLETQLWNSSTKKSHFVPQNL